MLETRLAQLKDNCTEEEKRRDPYLALTAVYSMACEDNREKAGRTKRQALNQGEEQEPPPEPLQGGSCPTCAVPEIFDEQYKFLQGYMTLEEDERFKIGHNFSGLVKSCTFRGRDCKDERLVDKSANKYFIKLYLTFQLL